VLNPLAAAVPLGLAEFTALIERLGCFEARPFVGVAVSGGPDSLALVILADRWARQRGGQICALSIDHRLRPESEAEINQLMGWLAARSIRHRVLVWEGEKPVSRIQETARITRYRLLEGWCRAHSCLHLLTGHHRDDQIETHLLRRDRRSGPDGLAAMSAIRETDSCRILRPLLDIPKARLLATLAVEAQPFITDPSNLNSAYARARLRDRGHIDRAPEFHQLRASGCERANNEQRRNELLAWVVALHPAGFAVLDPKALLAAPRDLAEGALSALVFALGDGAYPPRRHAVARLLRVLAGDACGGHVLGGYRFVAWRARVLVLRELAAAQGEARVEPGTSFLWDGRFTMSLASDAAPLTVRYLGQDGVAELYRQQPSARNSPLPALVRPVLPALWDEKGLAAVPFLGHRREPGIVPPTAAFAPVNSLSGASFAVV
jgi:tRNA(Ile)-lysidine synthase